MPTRKQRRRLAKERRHEYETVWVDSEGNELDEPPEDETVATRAGDGDKAKARSKAASRQQRGGRATREPPAPSWNRAIKRSLIWAAVLAALLVWLQSRASHPNYAATVPVAALYVVLFPVITYYLDRSMYRRWQARQKRDGAKKR